MIKHQKSSAFYDTFERKGKGQTVNHYCPGCGHGTVHNAIADALVELDIKDQAVFMAPVGCGVFIYYYFDTAAVQCAHGRAPATGTAVKRVHNDSIVISYQGDGDLAGIGSSEIIHAANRGENMTVIFVNNAIYGMTGGQMAPTTLIGQKTMTTPFGRDKDLDGMPLRVAEILDTMEAPVFIERTTLSNPAGVMKTRRAVKKALQNQKEKKGFSFVEVLSPCPINWKMHPVDARKWIKEHMEPFYEVKNFRDNDGEKNYNKYPFISDDELIKLLDVTQNSDNSANKVNLNGREERVKIAGFGGQGIMSVGVLLATCGVASDLDATWLPSYGPEMRGGTANASVVLSNEVIGTPVVDTPDSFIAMTIPSLDAFEDSVEKGGKIFVNSSLIDRKVKRDDVKSYYIPVTDLATEIGMPATAGVIMLAVYAKITGVFSIETLKAMIPKAIKKAQFIDINLKAIDVGLEYLEKNSIC